MMVLYALMGVWVSANSAVVPKNVFAIMAACSMVAVVREGAGNDSVALENNTMADKNNKTEWWSDCVVYNSSEPDAELHDDSAALENNTMEDNNKTELWPCDDVTHENSTAEADDLREMTTSWSWFGPSLIGEIESSGLDRGLNHSTIVDSTSGGGRLGLSPRSWPESDCPF